MQDFIAEGHDVLSSNHSYHMEKIMMDKYAYVVDITTAQVFVSENSDFTYSPAVFHEPFSLALQLNSAYTENVTQL